MSATPSAMTQATSDSTLPKRSSVERILVWGGILVLLTLVGFEYSTQRRYQNAWNTLQVKLEAGDKSESDESRLTNFDVPQLLGKKYDFKGHPGQITMSSQYYEAYVFPSLLKRKFNPPPEVPEEVDLFAIYTGEVRPDLIKYRTPEKREPASFFDARVLYVYYCPEDLKTHVREVISVVPERQSYFPGFLPLL